MSTNTPSPKLPSMGSMINTYGTVLILIVLLIVAQAMSDVFLTQRNMFNILRQVTATGLMSIGMLLVILKTLLSTR